MVPALASGNTPQPPLSETEQIDAEISEVQNKIDKVLKHFQNNMQIVFPSRCVTGNLIMVQKLFYQIAVLTFEFKESCSVFRRDAKKANDMQIKEYRNLVVKGYEEFKKISEKVLEDNSKRDTLLVKGFAERIQKYVSELRISSEKTLKIFHLEVLKLNKLSVKH